MLISSVPDWARTLGNGVPTAINFEGFIFPGPTIFTGAEFQQEVSFENAQFHQTVSFSHASFAGFASFAGSIFHSDAAIDRVLFHRDTDFNKVEFKKDACIVHTRFTGFSTFRSARCENLDLSGAEFGSEADFEQIWVNHSEFTGATFKHSLVRFTGASFEHVPDFRAVTFAAPPLFHDVEVKYAKQPGTRLWRLWFSCAAGAHDAARFRRLKQLASDWRDHERELEFFGKELRAKRFHETESLGAIVLNWAYGCLGDFGQSVWRPAFALLLSVVVVWALLLIRYSPNCAVTMEQSLAALWLSVTDWGLLLGADKWEVRREAFLKLCGVGCHFGLRASVLAYLQSAASLFLLFLLGLGLRNRFRTGST